MKLHSVICLAFLGILSVASIAEATIVKKCEGKPGIGLRIIILQVIC